VNFVLVYSQSIRQDIVLPICKRIRQVDVFVRPLHRRIEHDVIEGLSTKTNKFVVIE
jgi:hypothetical protein